MPVHAGADSLKKPHDIVTLSFSEVFFQVEGQAKYIEFQMRGKATSNF